MIHISMLPRKNKINSTKICYGEWRQVINQEKLQGEFFEPRYLGSLSRSKIPAAVLSPYQRW